MLLSELAGVVNGVDKSVRIWPHLTRSRVSVSFWMLVSPCGLLSSLLGGGSEPSCG